jgi:hypothetical protein
MLSRVDHLVYATPDLQAGVAEIAKRLGIQATPGGQHPGFGTRNALLSLGDKRYLEIIGPDVELGRPQKPQLFGIGQLAAPKLVTWAANCTELERLSDMDLGEGIRLGTRSAGSRQTPQGTSLSWQFTDPLTVIADGIVPFFIDWGNTPHPSITSAQGAQLLDLRAEHPDPERVQGILDRLGINLPVSLGPRAALVALILCPCGQVELR